METMNVLGLFFTTGVGLETWVRKGLMDREKLIYERLLEDRFNRIYWFTYGTRDAWIRDDLIKKGDMPPEIFVIGKPRFLAGRIGDIIYSLFMPFIRFRFVRACSVLKTNQIIGSWTGIIGKWLFKKPLLVRTGFTYSLFCRYGKKRMKYIAATLMEYLACRFSDGVVVSSGSDREYITKRYGTGHIDVNFNYIDTTLFRPMGTDKPEDLLFVGRLDVQKNILNLIKAVGKTNYTLDVYGDGRLQKTIETCVRQMGRDNQVRLRGVVSNNRLPEILNTHKIFVLPSFYEGMPKTLLEAMSCGCCCLATDVPGIRDVIRNNENGLLVGTSHEELRQGIERLMKDHPLRQKMEMQSRRTILDRYSLDKVFEKELSIYDEIGVGFEHCHRG
jgi:glycosyltransferase involved in cell wall biosynthesis